MTQLHVPKLCNVCGFCSHFVPVADGTVLYDGKWYHEKCWDDLTKDNGGYCGKGNRNR